MAKLLFGHLSAECSAAFLLPIETFYSAKCSNPHFSRPWQPNVVSADFCWLVEHQDICCCSCHCQKETSSHSDQVSEAIMNNSSSGKVAGNLTTLTMSEYKSGDCTSSSVLCGTPSTSKENCIGMSMLKIAGFYFIFFFDTRTFKQLLFGCLIARAIASWLWTKESDFFLHATTCFMFKKVLNDKDMCHSIKAFYQITVKLCKKYDMQQQH